MGVGENVLHRLVERGEGAEAGEDLPGTGQFISVENKTVYQTGYQIWYLVLEFIYKKILLLNC